MSNLTSNPVEKTNGLQDQEKLHTASTRTPDKENTPVEQGRNSHQLLEPSQPDGDCFAQADAVPPMEVEAKPDDVDEGHRFSAEETIMIFDWDDTVLPSFWVLSEGLRLDADSVPSPACQEQLADLARFAAKTLSIAKKLGTVVLVTNAERGWIELSCLKFLPALHPSLESVKIISARSDYESPTNASPFDWKLKAFTREIERVLLSGPCSRRNVLSIGDSAHEREALINATATIPNCRTKSLKFVERPTIDQLCKEHLLMSSCLERVVHHEGNLDLSINPI